MFDLEGEFRLEEISRPTLFVKIKVKFLWPSGDSLQCQVGGCESSRQVEGLHTRDVGQTLDEAIFVPEKLVGSHCSSFLLNEM